MSKNLQKLLAAIAERALKTFAQAFIAAYPVGNAIDGNGLVMGAQIAASAAFYSVLTSLASMKFGKNGPSLAAEQVVFDEVAGHEAG
jgi:hypothetical protein